MFNKVYLGITPISKIYLGNTPIKYGSEENTPENIVAVYTAWAKDVRPFSTEGLTDEKYIVKNNDDGTYTITITSLTPPSYIDFYLCSHLCTIEYINTTNLTRVSGMFSNCPLLKSVTMPDLTDKGMFFKMFYNCPKLTYVDIRNWDVVYSDEYSAFQYMFSGCTSLEELRLDNWDDITPIIRSVDFPTFTSGTHIIYCKYKATHLDAPQGWVYSFV